MLTVEQKIKEVSCKVIRPFLLDKKIQKVGIYVTLDYQMAREMESAKKVVFETEKVKEEVKAGK